MSNVLTPRLLSRVLILGAMLVTLLFVGPGNAAPNAVSAQEVPELQITSTYYIVIDAETGEIFAQRGAHEQTAMASLTKVFTAIEAIERGDPGTMVTTTDSDVFDDRSSRMGFGSGETFSLEDLLYGMMLPSGNDAAQAIARALGSDVAETDDEAVTQFVAWMNERVANMGLTDTHLVNPHGWGVPNHHSSVSDLAAFTMYALQYPEFVDLISSASYVTDNGYEVTNTNSMLNFYPGIVGGKTGYDDDAGYCLIEVATRDGSTMISVTLDGVAPDDWYDDNRVLLDYAFEQKAARLASGNAITGEVVTFRDPDAATIAANAEAGASFGAPPAAVSAAGAEEPAGDSASTLSPPAESGDESAPAMSSDSDGWSEPKLLAVVAVVVLIIAARAFDGLRGDRRQRSPLDVSQ